MARNQGSESKKPVRAAKRAVVFHIGLPKTGSTSIQHALVALADDLRARGVHAPYDRAVYGDEFPKSGVQRGAPQSDGFAYFFDVVDRRPDLRVDWGQALETFLDDTHAHAFVVSHENMSQVGHKLRRDLLASLADRADIRFLVYLRAPLSYLSSYCLQLVQGFGHSVPRADMQPVTRYLRGGYAGLLAPFAEAGQVDARNFDTLRKEDRLLPDFFAALGVEDMAAQIGALESQNTYASQLNLAIVFMALKTLAPAQEKTWFTMRRVLKAAAVDLEGPMQTSFLPAALAGAINDRWDEDRDILLRRYGVCFDAVPQFKPGPEVLSFDAEYAGALQEAAAPDLPPDLRDWLAQALKLAGQDLEEVARSSLSGQTKTVLKPKTSKKGDVIMTEDTKTRPEISHEDAVALARALFRAQNRKNAADDDEDSGDKPSFKEAKGEMLPLARRTLKLLHNQGYSLAKAAE